MGTTKDEQDRVRNLLLDTVTLLCKNGLSFKKQLKVQGLLGITLDEDDVFIVHINEKVGELIVEHQKKDKEVEDSDESSIDSTPSKINNRKRASDSSPMYRGPPDKIRIKMEKEEPDDDLILVEEDDKSSIQKTHMIPGQPTGLHTITNFQAGYQHYNPQNNLAAGGGFMPGGVNNTQQQHQIPHQNLQHTAQGTPDKQQTELLPHQQSGFWLPRSLVRRKIPYQEKEYVCDYPDCGLAYNIKSNLLRHQNIKHGRQNFKRPTRYAYRTEMAGSNAYLTTEIAKENEIRNNGQNRRDEGPSKNNNGMENYKEINDEECSAGGSFEVCQKLDTDRKQCSESETEIEHSENQILSLDMLVKYDEDGVKNDSYSDNQAYRSMSLEDELPGQDKGLDCGSEI